MIKYEPCAGETIQETARKMLAFNEEVEATFNGIRLVGDTEEEIIEAYHKALDQRPKTEIKNPYTGRKEKLALLLSGCPPMTLKDAEGWETAKRVNTDPYGMAIVRYVEQWARLMEKDLDWKEASHLADDEGITGFMYGCAVGILSQVWVRGEELRVWHNKEYGHKGAGVVNPAILTVEV